MADHEDHRLRGQVAVITGASRGIGAATAHVLAAEGCQLVLTSRNKSACDQISGQLKRDGIRIFTHECDVADPASVESLFGTVKAEFGRLDILINNAGVSHSLATVDKLPVETWRQVIDINLTGTFLVTRAALPLMRGGSTIVNNLSVAARVVFAGESAYCASKHALLGFNNTLREELRPRGIRVVALMPGATNTDLWDQFWPDAPREKMMSAETVAQAVVNVLMLPANSTVEELVIAPSSGSL